MSDSADHGEDSIASKVGSTISEADCGHIVIRNPLDCSN